MMEDPLLSSSSSTGKLVRLDDKYDIIEAFRSMMGDDKMDKMDNYKMDSHHGSSYKKNDPMMRMIHDGRRQDGQNGQLQDGQSPRQQLQEERPHDEDEPVDGDVLEQQKEQEASRPRKPRPWGQACRETERTEESNGSQGWKHDLRPQAAQVP